MDQQLYAYALRADLAGTVGDGDAERPQFDPNSQIALSDGSTYEVGAELAKGGGTIVTGDLRVIDALERYPAVERIETPKDVDRSHEPEDLRGRTIAQLLELEEASHVEGAGRMRRAELVQAIVAVREANTNGGE